MKLLSFIILLSSVGVIAGGLAANPEKISDKAPATVEDSIAAALDYQLTNYPVAQYRDVYKNFMQDFFGPGHILSDTAASGRYLRYELAETDSFDGPLFEPTGYKGNFMRVNIGLIADGTIPYNLFFDTFVESVKEITPPEGEDWMRRWNTIDSVIILKGIKFYNDSIDRIDLKKQFGEGNYIVHHSKRYNDSVSFHYRIISAPLFRERILPLIKTRHNLQ